MRQSPQSQAIGHFASAADRTSKVAWRAPRLSILCFTGLGALGLVLAFLYFENGRVGADAPVVERAPQSAINDRLTRSVEQLSKDIGEMKATINDRDTRLRAIETGVARIEGALGTKPPPGR